MIAPGHFLQICLQNHEQFIAKARENLANQRRRSSTKIPFPTALHESWWMAPLTRHQWLSGTTLICLSLSGNHHIKVCGCEAKRSEVHELKVWPENRQDEADYQILKGIGHTQSRWTNEENPYLYQASPNSSTSSPT